MTLLLQAAYRTHVVFIRTIVKFRGDTHSKNRLKYPDSIAKEQSWGELMFPIWNFTTVIQTGWYWQWRWFIDQQNEIENIEINQNVFFFCQGCQNLRGGKNNLLNRLFWDNWKWSLYTTWNSRRVYVLNLRTGLLIVFACHSCSPGGWYGCFSRG